MAAIMGLSGSGKSILLNIPGILNHHDESHYHLDNQLIDNLVEKRSAQKNIVRWT
jgi:ABC-type lipoprotein export system ATPase subunit